MRQLYLDLRQKDFAGVVCEECGMRYDRSFPEELKLHAKFHKAQEKRFWRGKGRHYLLPLKVDQSRVTIEKVKTGKEPLKKPLNELLAFLEDQCSLLQQKYEASEVYLMLTTERQVIGCLVLLKEERECVLRPEGTMLTCKAVVQLVWMHEQYRGKKLGQALIKAGCISEQLDPSELAFSTTTRGVLGLSRKLLQRDSYISLEN